MAALTRDYENPTGAATSIAAPTGHEKRPYGRTRGRPDGRLCFAHPRLPPLQSLRYDPIQR